MTHDYCSNCQQPLTENFRYCPQCGQSTHLHRINAAHLLHDAVHFFTHADKGIFFLVKELAVRPGKVAREYIGGRRKKYFNPLNFFFIVLGLFVFTLTFFHTFEQRSSMAEAKAEVQKIENAAVRERRLGKLQRVETAMSFVGKYSNFVSMAATPLVAAIFFLFFLRGRYNYTEHLVAHLYMAGFNGLVFIFIAAPLIWLAGEGANYRLIIFLFLLFGLIYKAIGYYQFINKSGKPAFAKAFAASLVASVAWYFISTQLIFLYIETGFKLK